MGLPGAGRIPGEALFRRGGGYLGKYGIYKYVHPFNKNKYFIKNVCFVADKQLTTYKQPTRITKSLRLKSTRPTIIINFVFPNQLSNKALINSTSLLKGGRGAYLGHPKNP